MVTFALYLRLKRKHSITISVSVCQNDESIFSIPFWQNYLSRFNVCWEYPDIFLSIGNEKQRNAMSLPKDIAVDVLNNCFAMLVSDGTQIALSSVHYLLTEKEYSSHIYADKVCLASLMQKKAPDDMVLSLIEKGAQLTGTPSALDVFIEHSNVCQQNNQILLRLIEKGVDVSKYITVKNREPWQHTLVRLCVQLGECYL